MTFDQSECDLRCEWGPAGVHLLAPTSDVVIIVDVLRFSTAVDIALARGASVQPYRWQDTSAPANTASLSPSELLSVPAGSELVMPSPNGSMLALDAGTAVTFTACLRNCRAVAARARECGPRIAVIPAGERWPDGSLRPAIEDLIGAGAVLATLPGPRSPEAEVAVAAFERFRGDLHDALTRCSSGKELIERGLAGDVELAAEYAVSSTAPILKHGRFVHS